MIPGERIKGTCVGLCGCCDDKKCHKAHEWPYDKKADFTHSIHHDLCHGKTTRHVIHILMYYVARCNHQYDIEQPANYSSTCDGHGDSHRCSDRGSMHFFRDVCRGVIVRHDELHRQQTKQERERFSTLALPARLVDNSAECIRGTVHFM